MCPSKKHAPQTIEGAQAWDLLQRCQGQVRIAPMGGVIGLDMATALKMAEALGYESGDMCRLLPWAEAGMVEGLSKKDGDDAE